MAKQKGILKIQGTLDDITFFKSQDGYMVRQKGGVSSERIQNDPSFQRTRENGAEFGRAGKAGKIVRTAFRPVIQLARDNRVVGRLTKAMMQVVKSDTASARGSRNVAEGDISILEGFEFNTSVPLSNTLFAPYTATIDRVTGSLSVEIGSFMPLSMLAAPAGTTHFKMVSAAAEIDFATHLYTVDTSESTMLMWDNEASGAITPAGSLTPNSTKHLLLLLGVQFYQEVNGTQYPLKNGTYNALALVKASKS